MAMAFERAIESASTLFLFDRRSQQQLQEMADAALPRTRDRYLLRLTQAAFAYYNAVESQAANMRRTIGQADEILREVKRFREDRVFYTLALRLEVDLLMHTSTLNLQETPAQDRSRLLYAEEDERALSICETLLKNLPQSFDPLPEAWYSSVIPLFPPYQEDVIQFYQDRVKDNRIPPLQNILIQVRDELVFCSGVLRAKKYIAERRVTVRGWDVVNKFMLSRVGRITRLVEGQMPARVALASDMSLPRGIAFVELDAAIDTAENQAEFARSEKDIRRFAQSLQQVGILNFLRDNPEETVSALSRTLKASGRISAEDKKLRQYRYDEFSDIPFMMGTSFLRAAAQGSASDEQEQMLQNASIGLMRALQLQKAYHQAYVNLVVTFRLKAEPENEAALLDLYLASFDNDLSQLNGLAFRNLAFLEFVSNRNRYNPEVVMWVVLSQFCKGGELTKANKMLQELKTAYILNAHQFSVAYLETYRGFFRLKDAEFIKDLENNELHSALLFYIAHAFTSISLTQGRNSQEPVIDYAHLDQSIELNGESLYFNPKNRSALRLVDTQSQVLQYGLQRTQKRWDNIKNMMGQRFGMYEEYLRQMRTVEKLRELMKGLEMEDRLPELDVSTATRARMEDVINTEQRDRLRHRVEAS